MPDLPEIPRIYKKSQPRPKLHIGLEHTYGEVFMIMRALTEYGYRYKDLSSLQIRDKLRDELIAAPLIDEYNG
tara:strand:+ start:594 stop:812 length:219 start_codon:yes stop_codon:yes gene_type:complete